MPWQDTPLLGVEATLESCQAQESWLDVAYQRCRIMELLFVSSVVTQVIRAVSNVVSCLTTTLYLNLILVLCFASASVSTQILYKFTRILLFLLYFMISLASCLDFCKLYPKISSKY